MLDVFGGKITTHRRLAEAALAKLAPHFPGLRRRLDRRRAAARRRLRLGRRAGAGRRARAATTRSSTRPGRARLVRLYGTDAARMLDGARSAADLGERFGSGLTERELAWLRDREWARTAEDVLWRRTKLGLRLAPAEAARVDAWMRGEAARDLAAPGLDAAAAPG